MKTQEYWHHLSKLYDTDSMDDFYVCLKSVSHHTPWEFNPQNATQEWPSIKNINELFQRAYHSGQLPIMEYLIQEELVVRSELFEVVFSNWPKPWVSEIQIWFQTVEEKKELEKHLLPSRTGKECRAIFKI